MGAIRRAGVATALVFLMVSCGGGGGGNSSSGGSSSTTYLGSVGPGDFARVTISGNTLTYEISGSVLGNKSGTLQMEAYPGKKSFYKLLDDNRNKVADVFLSGNMVFAGVNIDGNYYALVGLKKVENGLKKSDVIGTYNYVHVKNPGPTLEYYRLQVYDNGTYSAENILNPSVSETGCWKLAGTGDYLLAKAGESDCNNVNNWDYKIVVRPGTRKAIVVDYVDGSGFGIGLESYNMTSVSENMTTCTVEYYWWNTNRDEDGWGNATYNRSNGTINLEEYDFDGTPEGTISGTVRLDKIYNGTDFIPHQGMAFLSTQNGNGTIFFDPDEGYFIDIFNETGTIYYSIGKVSCQ